MDTVPPTRDGFFVPSPTEAICVGGLYPPTYATTYATTYAKASVVEKASVGEAINPPSLKLRWAKR